MKHRKPQPQFLTVLWEGTGREGTAVTVQAVLCLRHRKEIALQHPSARGCGQPGETCDMCEGLKPRTPQGACRSSKEPPRAPNSGPAPE